MNLWDESGMDPAEWSWTCTIKQNKTKDHPKGPAVWVR